MTPPIDRASGAIISSAKPTPIAKTTSTSAGTHERHLREQYRGDIDHVPDREQAADRTGCRDDQPDEVANVQIPSTAAGIEHRITDGPADAGFRSRPGRLELQRLRNVGCSRHEVTDHGVGDV